MSNENTVEVQDVKYVPITGRVLDITGNIYGELVIIGHAGIIKKRRKWYCECSCGNIKLVNESHLKNGNTKSCGCAKGKTHCKSHLDEYKIWHNIKTRCSNTNIPNYHNYGGRGIRVSNEWESDFMSFYSDMGKRPSKKHSIERIDNDGNYCKENCRWATSKEQIRNKRNSVIVNYNGESVFLYDYCVKMNLKYNTIFGRIKRFGWSVEKALSTPVKIYNHGK